MFVGIDYGSKLAGTTVICYEQDGMLYFVQSEKKHNADELILRFVREHHPSAIFLDAPLSLPKAYFGKGEDFFYRAADRATRAMSPMFIGGLTARAMRLHHQLSADGVTFYEAYPAGLANFLQLKPKGYKVGKTPVEALIKALCAQFSIELARLPVNWHQFDSLLAYIIGLRHSTNTAQVLGNRDEGLIYF